MGGHSGGLNAPSSMTCFQTSTQVLLKCPYSMSQCPFEPTYALAQKPRECLPQCPFEHDLLSDYVKLEFTDGSTVESQCPFEHDLLSDQHGGVWRCFRTPSLNAPSSMTCFQTPGTRRGKPRLFPVSMPLRA